MAIIQVATQLISISDSDGRGYCSKLPAYYIILLTCDTHKKNHIFAAHTGKMQRDAIHSSQNEVSKRVTMFMCSLHAKTSCVMRMRIADEQSEAYIKYKHIVYLRTAK